MKIPCEILRCDRESTHFYTMRDVMYQKYRIVLKATPKTVYSMAICDYHETAALPSKDYRERWFDKVTRDDYEEYLVTQIMGS